MTNYNTTPAIPLTEEDRAIILDRNPALDTVIGMLVGDWFDGILMTNWEWDKKWIARQQWEMDNVY